jgi:hypothetical protein
VLLRLNTFPVPEGSTQIHTELRAYADQPYGRCRWVGRRLADEPPAVEMVALWVWDDPAEMDRTMQLRRRSYSEELNRVLVGTRPRVYDCRVYGAWKRDKEPCLIRIFRGTVSEGDPAAFGGPVLANYLAMFEANPSCVSIVAGVREDRDVVLATLWTDWDAIVTATRGDIRQVLPLRLPGWAVEGSALHYEIVAAEFRPDGVGEPAPTATA